MNQLNEEKNKELLEQLNKEQKKVKELNDKINFYENNTINNNLKIIKELEETIKSLKSQINDLKNSLDKAK